MINFLRHKEDLFHWSDPFIAIAYIIVIFIIAIFIKGYYQKKKSEYSYMIKGLMIKVGAAIAFTMVYLFYYDDGDTILYFEGARTLTNIFLDNPSEYFKFLFSSINFDYDLQYIRSYITYSKSPEEWFMIKLISPITLISFNRFLIAQIVMSVVTFYGSWKMFQAFLFFYPEKHKAAFYAVFLVPSVIFWGSGILKDSVTFAFLGIFLFYSIRTLYIYKINIKAYAIMLLSIYIIFNIKAYIILSFFPVITLGWVAYNRNRIKSRFFRNILTPFILTIALYSGGKFITDLQSESEKYAVGNLQERVQGFHNWHAVLGGSSYSLGEIEYTPLGILKKVPAALNVTFFRPYPTEISSAAVAMGSVEAFFFLIIFILILIHYQHKWLKVVFKSPLLTIAFSYTIIFGFIVGFTSYNFGALARYKIPVMPFFAYILFYFYFEYREKKKLEKEMKAKESEKLGIEIEESSNF